MEVGCFYTVTYANFSTASFILLMPSIIFLSDVANESRILSSDPNAIPGTTATRASSRRYDDNFEERASSLYLSLMDLKPGKEYIPLTLGKT